MKDQAGNTQTLTLSQPQHQLSRLYHPVFSLIRGNCVDYWTGKRSSPCSKRRPTCARLVWACGHASVHLFRRRSRHPRVRYQVFSSTRYKYGEPVLYFWPVPSTLLSCDLAFKSFFPSVTPPSSLCLRRLHALSLTLELNRPSSIRFPCLIYFRMFWRTGLRTSGRRWDATRTPRKS